MGRLKDYMNTEVSIRHASTIVKDNGEYYILVCSMTDWFFIDCIA